MRHGPFVLVASARRNRRSRLKWRRRQRPLSVEALEQRYLLTGAPPTALLVVDNGVADLQPAVGQVTTTAATPAIEIQLSDNASGVDDSTAQSSVVALTRDGAPLVEGAGGDYVFSYEPATDLIALTPPAGDFAVGSYAITITGVADNAGNVMPPTLLEFEIGIASLKNVIVMIGDGMGFEHVAAARMFLGGSIAFDDFPHQAEMITASANSAITDSAASGTAMATGSKVNNGVVSVAVPGDGADLLTSLEIYQTRGKSTGLVSTSYMTHATPATFAAHATTRNDTAAIADDYLNQTRPNVLLGGGGHDLSPAAAAAAGYTVATDRDALMAIDTDVEAFISGQFGTDHLPYEFDGAGLGVTVPHLSEMAAVALDALEYDPDGFFLMIEGARIDHAGHANDIQRNVHETVEFANTVQYVLDWAAGRTDTLIVVTADHETGGLQVVQDNGAGVMPDVAWSTGGHSSDNVPLYAWGTSAHQVVGVLDNTDIFALTTADIEGPVATLANPLDNDAADYDPAAGAVTIDRGRTAFEVQLTDAVNDVDDISVAPASVVLTQEGVALVEGTDYTFAYDAVADGITLTGQEPFDNGTYGLTVSVEGARIEDSVGNPMPTATFDVVVDRSLSSSFTIAMLPDTQFYSQSYPEQFEAQTQWIVDHIATDNIVFASHVGDVVQDGGEGPDQNLQEWHNGDAAVDTLDGDPVEHPDGLLPYAVAVGNHDYDTVDDHASANRFVEFFGASRYAGRNWYGGASANELNHFQRFQAGGVELLHINLEWEPRDDALAWAQSVIDSHPQMPAILTTHAYLTPSGARSTGTRTADGNSGEAIYQQLVAPNPEIFLVLGGHYSGEAHAIATNSVGLEVVEVLANYQDRNNGGDGYLRLFDIVLDEGRIDARTYSPTRDQYEDDANSEFSVYVDFDRRFDLAFPPTAQLVEPEDNGPDDADPSDNAVVIHGDQATFTVQLDDLDDGIDDASVLSSVVSVSKNDTFLQESVHYTFDYDTTLHRIVLSPVGGDFGVGNYEIALSVGPQKVADVDGDQMDGVTFAVQVVPASMLPQTLTFQQGAGGYNGTVDTWIQTDSAIDRSAETTLRIDQNDSSNEDQTLLRFNEIIAAGAIPTGSTILSATLSVDVVNRSADTPSLFRMTQDWEADNTWSDFAADAAGGIQAGSETEATPDASYDGSNATGIAELDVTSSVAAWAAGQANYGWAILYGTIDDGWHVQSAEGTTPPTLTVEFIPANLAPQAALADPLDNGPDDYDPAEGSLLLPELPTELRIQLGDAEDGVDDATVVANTLQISRDGLPLSRPDDYAFAYDPPTDVVTLTPASGSFADGQYEILLSTGAAKIADLLGNEMDATTLTVVVDQAAVPPPQYEVKHEPYLQLGDAPLGAASDQAVVMWQTVPAGSGQHDSFSVEYRKAGDATWIDAGSVSTIDTGVAGRINHFVSLTGLEFSAGFGSPPPPSPPPPAGPDGDAEGGPDLIISSGGSALIDSIDIGGDVTVTIDSNGGGSENLTVGDISAHNVTINANSGPPPPTYYEYRVVHRRAGAEITAYEGSFQTRLQPGSDQPFTFVAYGDSARGDPPAAFISVQQQINAIDSAFALLLGDNAYDDGSHADFDRRLDPSVNGPATQYVRDHIEYPAMGNHDVGTNGGQPSRDNFSVPIPADGPAGELDEHNYSFDYGNAHFVTFDSNSWDDPARLTTQLQWVANDLQLSTATWNIVFVHHPVISMPDHGEHDASTDYYQQVVSTLRDSGADLMLAGHSHSWQRSNPLLGQEDGNPAFARKLDNDYEKGNGLPHLIVGTGGATLGSGAIADDSYLAAGFTLDTTPAVQYGFARIDVTSERLVVSYVTADGDVLDAFSIGPDVSGPMAGIAAPEDNGSDDFEPATDQVVVNATPAAFEIRFDDVTGIDDATVHSGVLSVSKNGASFGDFAFAYLPASDTIRLTPTGGEPSFANGVYEVTISAASTVSDLLGNDMAPTTLRIEVDTNLVVQQQATFQQGDGYAGTVDTMLQQFDANGESGSAGGAGPATDHSATLQLSVDADDPPSSYGLSQVLLRFNEIFGTDPGHIPLGATIDSATLSLNVTNPGSGINLHRMLIDWNDTDTWNTFGGIQADDVEAVAAADAAVGAGNNNSNVPVGTLTLDVAASVQAWSDGNANFGWALLPFAGGTNGADVNSSEVTTSGNRPQLAVTYSIAPPAPPPPPLHLIAMSSFLVAEDPPQNSTPTRSSIETAEQTAPASDEAVVDGLVSIFTQLAAETSANPPSMEFAGDWLAGGSLPASRSAALGPLDLVFGSPLTGRRLDIPDHPHRPTRESNRLNDDSQDQGDSLEADSLGDILPPNHTEKPRSAPEQAAKQPPVHRAATAPPRNDTDSANTPQPNPNDAEVRAPDGDEVSPAAFYNPESAASLSSEVIDRLLAATPNLASAETPSSDSARVSEPADSQQQNEATQQQ